MMMKKEDLVLLRGKRVKVILKNNFTYTGYFKELGDDSARFLDKFNNTIVFSYDSIAAVVEEEGEEKKER